MKNTIAISSDFLTAFAALPRQIQGKVTDFINKFRNNPTAPGINYEKIKCAADSKMCSVRIDDTYRGIVARQKESGVYLLLWVDRHDDAYEWARGKKCSINPDTGGVQVFDIRYIENDGSPMGQKIRLFESVSDEDLVALGVPKEEVAFVRTFLSVEDFFNSKNVLPADAYENLEWLINGFEVKEVIELYRSDIEDHEESDNLAEALKQPESLKSFFIVEGEDELKRIMAEPLEKWRVFLHPSQRIIVEKTYYGPARVLGGAGTGKTVVAMHRAKWLAGRLSGKEKLLFTTFTANLAGDIKDNLKKICTVEELRHIDIINLDAWVSQFLREQGYPNSIIYDEKLDEIWEQAVALSGEDIGLPVSFYSDEWSKVVASNDAFSLEDYLKISRIGRGTRLNRVKRIQVWKVFDEYQNILREKQVRDVDTAMYECRKLLEKLNPNPYYNNIIVDEGQDFSMPAYRLLRTLAGEEHPDDMIIVGDAHQRIYKKKITLSKSGINVRGRSSYLRINYRTTEEIRKHAFALLKGITFDDLDENYDDGRVCQSLTHGKTPEIHEFKSAAEELIYLVDTLHEMEHSGVDLKTVCIVVRTHKLLNDYIAGFTRYGIKTYEIKRSKLDDHNYEGVRVATMHRVKGLEFRQVFIVAVNKHVIPLASAIDHTDAVAELESLTSEKCLLYVALTRAQESANLSYYGTPSELLET